MRYELNLIVSGMNKEKLDALYELLDDNHYDYVGRENTYDEWEGMDEVYMNFEEYKMYIAFAFDKDDKLYKFIRGIRDDGNGIDDQINLFLDDIYNCLGTGSRVDILVDQDDIKFEGTTVEYNWRHGK